MPSAAILAGGQARRYGGRDKSGLLIGGVSIFDRQVKQLSQITDDILVVVAQPGRGKRGARLVCDRVANAGPLGGLDAALEFARDDEVVVVACDMPFVTAPLIRYLISVAPGFDAVVPRTGAGIHPLCAVYMRTCKPSIGRRLAVRQLSMTSLLDDLRVRVVTDEELQAFGRPADLLANVNSPVEFDELAVVSGHER